MDATNPTEQRDPVSTNDDEPDAEFAHLTQVSRAMVAIYKEYFGRGPRHAQSHYAGPNVIVCLLEGTFTTLEKTLAGMGEFAQLRGIREFFQAATEDTFRATVEEITGRQTVAFLSANDIRKDVASEMFVLSPEPK
jgi:uncharacterized protein YbcI